MGSVESVGTGPPPLCGGPVKSASLSESDRSLRSESAGVYVGCSGIGAGASDVTCGVGAGAGA